MNAWVLHDINDFRLERAEKPVPGSSEVLVKVKAAGICGSDNQNGTYSFPLIPGHEFSGVVTEAGGAADAGADIFFECVGKNETLTWAVEYTAPGGRVMLVGNPFSDMHLEKTVYWKSLRNQLTVTGTWNSSFSFPETEPSIRKAERMEDTFLTKQRLSKQGVSDQERRYIQDIGQN